MINGTKHRQKFFAALTVLLVLMTVISSFTFRAKAESVIIDLSKGSAEIIGGDDALGINYCRQGDLLFPMYDGDDVIVITTEPTRNSLYIRDNVKIHLTFRNVTIENTYFLKSPVCLDNGEDVILTFEGENKLSAGSEMAGIQVGPYASLVINGTGTAEITGGKNAAGIGGGWRTCTVGTDCGDITIEGGVILKVTGGENGAGIGGGAKGSAGTITVTDTAEVWAYGGINAAGIGSGSEGSCTSVSVKGRAKVYSSGGENGAGIGNSLNSELPVNINITEYCYVEALGGRNACAIGGGNGGNVRELSISGYTTVRAQGGENSAAIGASAAKTAKSISISGNAAIRAIGGKNSSAIGGALSAVITDIRIVDNANIYAVAGSNAAAIGCGMRGKCENMTIGGRSVIKAFGGQYGSGIGTGHLGTSGTLSIGDFAEIRAVGGTEAAGIGLGTNGTMKSLTISGNSNVIAVGGKNGAGIGTGSESVSMPDIVIKGKANVTAQGGNYGAGIGYGGKFLPDVFVAAGKLDICENAVVKAAGGKYGAGIGGGKYSGGITFKAYGKADVTAKSDTEIKIDVKEIISIAPEEPEPLPETQEGENDKPEEGETGEDPENPGEEGKEGEEGEIVGPVIIKTYEYKHSNYAFGDIILQPIESEEEKPVEGALVGPINQVYDFEAINAKNEDIIDISELKASPAKDVGAGAGCLFMGSCIIREEAKVNDMIGDVSVTLVYGINGFEDQVTSLKKGDNFTFPTPEKEGYDFKGWFYAKESGEKVSGTIKIDKDVTFYARWNVIGVAISSVQPEDGFIGREYTQNVFSASGGAKPYRFSLSEGTIPKGLVLSSEDGSISGTPEESGKFSFTVTVTDGNGSANSSFVTMNVFGSNTFRFVFTTADEQSADTAGRVSMKFDYFDYFTGERMISDTFDVTELLSKKYSETLGRGTEQQFDITFPANITEPRKIYLELNDDDGWKCESVSVVFNGNAFQEPFSHKFDINTWYGKRDDGGMTWVDIVVLILIIIAVAVLLVFIIIVITKIDKRTRSSKTGDGKEASGKKKSGGIQPRSKNQNINR